MVITIVCDVLGAENNGTTIAAMNLIRSLRRAGHEVRVVCADAARAGEPGFFVVPTVNFGPLNGYVARNGVTLAKPQRAVLEAAMQGADAVHVMIPLALGSAAARLAQTRGLPLTAGFHCQAENVTNHIFLMNAPAANRLAYRIFYQKLYRRCDAIHYPTQFICDTFERIVGPTNHYVISNGVNRAFTPGPAVRPAEWAGKFAVLFTGRYSREKSHAVLVDAVARSRHRDRIQLVFAGRGPQEEAIRRRAQARGILPPVMRFYSRAELINVIRSADLYVHPAEIEIEAIACLEAIACGKTPVIADSPRSATRYFARTPENLFRCNDPDDLAAKIDYWIDHPDARAKNSAEYANYAAQFDFDVCMRRMERMIRETAARKAKARAAQ